MGWNNIELGFDHQLFKRISKEDIFYFVHSYHVSCAENYQLSTTNYGYSFVSGIHKDNILGVQFHPEKSHGFGVQLLKNFGELL